MRTVHTDVSTAPRTKTGLARAAHGYWELTKSRQTLLLVTTGLTGWLSGWREAGPARATLAPAGRPVTGSLTEAGLMMFGLFAAISGTTALNMVLDRDIDARMTRTQDRPIPAGIISPARATLFGGALVALGLGTAFSMHSSFGSVILAGVILDLLTYTLWLKRRTPWAILFGGISGGMPVLAGRVLITGRVDLVGMALVASVLTWIPSHVVSLTIRYADDYQRGGVPTWPSACGFDGARRFIAISEVVRLAALATAGHLLAIGPWSWGLLILSGAVMVSLSLWHVYRPSPHLNRTLFKAASFHILAAMILLTLGTVV